MADGNIGHWSFIVGVLLAVLAGLVPTLQTSSVTWILVVLGLVVGFLNVTARETTEFLVASIALLIVTEAGAIPVLGGTVLVILSNIAAFVAPAALIVALRAVWVLAQE